MTLFETDEGYFFWFLEDEGRKYYSQIFYSPSEAYNAILTRRIVWN